MAEPALRWRLLEDGIEDPFLQFAVEEALLRRVAEGRSVPTLRLRRSVPSVWIGVYQEPWEEVDLAFCRREGLPVVRRPNPGGAVYQDRGTFCYTAFFPRDPDLARLGAAQTRDLYGIMAGVVLDVCAALGVAAEASPVNDVAAGGRKVYGSAQIEWGPAIAHSGTFLVQADLGAMEAALHPPALKFSGKGATCVRDRVANLSEAAGRPIAVPEAMARFVEAFSRRLPVVLEPGDLGPAERADAEALLHSKYATEEWTFPRRRPFATTLATRAASGVLSLDLRLEGDRVASMDVRGDFLLERQEDLAAFLAQARARREGEALALLGASPLPEDLKLALGRLIHEGFDRGVPRAREAT